AGQQQPEADPDAGPDEAHRQPGAGLRGRYLVPAVVLEDLVDLLLVHVGLTLGAARRIASSVQSRTNSGSHCWHFSWSVITRLWWSSKACWASTTNARSASSVAVRSRMARSRRAPSTMRKAARLGVSPSEVGAELTRYT